MNVNLKGVAGIFTEPPFVLIQLIKLVYSCLEQGTRQIGQGESLKQSWDIKRVI